jgi:hypothetical protein
MKTNIKNQLSQLFDINNCFIFNSKVYEVLSQFKYKYRVVINFDDYDYVTDKLLKKQLDKHLRQLTKYL